VKKLFARLVSLMLIALTLMPMLPVPAQAATSWPSLGSSKYCEFTASKQIYVYRNASCTTRGTSSPAKSYNAYIDKNDVCRILEITSSYIKLQYPTSSGYKTGYVKRSAVLGVSSPSTVVTSKGKVTTYKTSGGSSYGYVAKGDKVYVCGTSGNYTAVIYQAKSGNRAYKLGYVKTSQYNSTIVGSTPNTNSTSTSNKFSGWQWPVSGRTTTQKFNNYSSSMAKKGRPYHCGIDIVSSNKTIKAAATGTVKYKGYTNGNGNHVIIEHNVNGKTVYTLYSHLANYNACPSKGSTVQKGAQIGVMGSTGNSTGVHLHFAIFSGAYSSDPLGYVSKSGANKITYNKTTFYNPTYVINNGKLP